MAATDSHTWLQQTLFMAATDSTYGCNRLAIRTMLFAPQSMSTPSYIYSQLVFGITSRICSLYRIQNIFCVYICHINNLYSDSAQFHARHPPFFPAEPQKKIKKKSRPCGFDKHSLMLHYSICKMPLFPAKPHKDGK